MKNTTRKILLSLLPLLFVSIACGATIPTMDVTVSTAGGKDVYKGKTNANGTFATGNLEPGNYVVLFTSKSPAVKGAKFGLVATAGKNQMSSDSVAGEKFADPGTAMRIAVAAPTKITGQVTIGAAAVAKGAATTTAAASGSGSGKGKIINGKRYIWKLPLTGSVSGGEWVEESAGPADGNVRVPQNQPPPRSSSSRY